MKENEIVVTEVEVTNYLKSIGAKDTKENRNKIRGLLLNMKSGFAEGDGGRRIPR